MSQPQTGVSLETVAVIAAALAAAMDRPVGSFRITGIQPVRVGPATGWAQAGILERHLNMRRFGLRTP
ncbi:MAG TPA: hypothetical protein VIL07_07655 [Symbiobacteriaceae bacterium]